MAEHPADALCALATVLARLARNHEAEAELRKALVLSPSHAQANYNLAVLLAECGERRGALEHYDRALEADPANAGARANRASLRLALGDPLGALADYEALCASAEADEHSLAGRVRALLLLDRDEEALQRADELVALHPGYQAGWQLKAMTAASLNRMAEAHAACARAGLSMSPRTLFIERALGRQAVCNWRDRDVLVDTLRAALQGGGEPGLWSAGLLFHSLALPLSGGEIKTIAEHVAARVRQAAPSLEDLPPVPRGPGHRIRVGFMSPDIRIHPGAHLLWPLFRERDREKFEYVIYALNPDDGSGIRKSLAASADGFVDASSWTAEQLVRRIRRDGLDVFIDRSGYFEGTRPEVTAARVAPLQVGYLGIPSTMGDGMLDYRITDANTILPGQEKDWWENLVILPAPHWAYDTDVQPGEGGTRADWKLPQNGFVFCCFNQAFKLGPTLFALWMRLLRQVPASVLWLLEPGEVARTNLRREALAAGVEPERLIFAGRMDLGVHLARTRHADLFLDTLEYGAHTTAADALHAGVPVLTCPGETMVARLCSTMVRGAGLPDLVVDDLDAYERLALEIARSSQLAGDLRRRLRDARSKAPFFDLKKRVRCVEQAFAAIVERHRAGLPPATLSIE